MTTPLALARAVFFGALGIAKLAAAPPMRAAAGHLGFTAVIAHLRNADPAVRVLVSVVTAALLGAYALLLTTGRGTP